MFLLWFAPRVRESFLHPGHFNAPPPGAVVKERFFLVRLGFEFPPPQMAPSPASWSKLFLDGSPIDSFSKVQVLSASQGGR